MKYYIFVLFIIIANTVYAQKPYSVSGIIEDKEKQPIESATIRLLTPKDSTFIQGTVTNTKGHFSISTSKKEILMEISFMGYKKKYENISLTKTKSLNLGTIQLSEQDIKLDEVVIKAEAPAISIKGDTLEYNSGSYKVPENATVKELLKRLPNVTVDEKGNITVQGKKVTKIMVDGKNFFSGDPELASKTLPAEMVNKVQVYDKNSEAAEMSGFDDEKKETVINLSLKEEMKVAILSSATGGLGHDMKSDGKYRYTSDANINAMLNQDQYSFYMSKANTTNSMWGNWGGENEDSNIAFNINKDLSKKFKLNGSITYGASNTERETYSETETFVSDKDKLYETSKDINNNHSKRFGYNSRMQWDPDKHNKIVIQSNLNYNNSNGTSNNLFSNLNSQADTLYNGYSQRKDGSNGIDFRIAVDYAYKFNKKGRVLSTSIVNGIRNNKSQDFYNWKQRLFESGIYDRDSLINQRSEGNNNSYNFQGSLSYVEPIKKDYFVQVAYNLTLSNDENVRSAYDFFNPVEYPDSIQLNPLQSRSTQRNVTTQRFTANFRGKKKKYDYTIGINVDLNSSVNKTLQPSNETVTKYAVASTEKHAPNIIGDSIISRIEQNTVNFSPIMNFQYKFSDRANLRINYNGYITQPSASQLQDFTDVSNPTNSVKGNPNLKSNFMNSINANFSNFNRKSFAYFSINLSSRFSFNDIQSAVTINPETGFRMTTYENVNGNWSLNLSNNFNIPLKNKKFNIGNYLYTSFNQSKSILNENTNTMHRLNINENPIFNYHSDKLGVMLRGMFTYAMTDNKNQPESNTKTFDWGINGTINYELPLKFNIETSVNWTQKAGYGEGYNYSEVLWNASLSREVFSTKKYGSGLLRVAVDDILQAKKSISRTVTNSFIQNTMTNIPGSYFMCSFTYNFNIFPKGAGKSMMISPMMMRGYSIGM